MVTLLLFWALAQEPAPTEQKYEALVQQLGDDDFAKREAAEKELRAAGKAAHSALQKGLESDDLEIRERCRRILEDSNEEAGDGSEEQGARTPDGPVSRIRLVVKSVGLDGESFELSIGESGDVTLKVDGKTYKAASARAFQKDHPELYEKYVKPYVESNRIVIRRSVGGRTDPPLEDPWKELEGWWEKELKRLREMLEKWDRDDPDEPLRKWMDDWEKFLEKSRKAFERRREQWKGREQEIPSQDSSIPRSLGAVFVPLEESERESLGLPDTGVRIQEVYSDSVAMRLGLQKEDILLSVNSEAVRNAIQARMLLRKALRGEKVSVTVLRSGERKILEARSEDLLR